jgi:hypothetical protein
MQSAVRCSALPQFGSQSELERFIKQILQRLPCLARNFAKQQRCVVIDINCEVGYIGFIRFGRWITESSNKSFNQFFLLLRCHAQPFFGSKKTSGNAKLFRAKVIFSSSTRWISASFKPRSADAASLINRNSLALSRVAIEATVASISDREINVALRYLQHTTQGLKARLPLMSLTL